MSPLITDWMIAISSIITGVVGIIGVFIALYQIYQIKNQLKNGSEELKNATSQLKNTTLTNVLSLEAEMNDRKEKVDNINNEIEKQNLDNKLTQDVRDVYEKFQNAAIENWLNSIDRLCFCIKNNYLIEKDWKVEYRDYIINVVKTFENKFGVASRYKNIIDTRIFF
jgi:uncharacterized membrane-anchored protein YhcB (DUF1043 family)